MKAVLFDLDETLILDEKPSHDAFRAAAALATPLGIDVAELADHAEKIAFRRWQEGPVYRYCLRIGHSAWQGLWAQYDVGNYPMITALRGWAPLYQVSVWIEALDEKGIVDETLASAMATRFKEVRDAYPLYPEVSALLKSLKEKGYKLGIVTDGVPDLQRRKLVGSGLLPHFDAVVVAGEISCGKPDPEIFRYICTELGVGPADCVMVGDHPEMDIAGAMAAGMASVWVSRNGRQPDPRYPGNFTCTDLSAMLPWLATR